MHNHFNLNYSKKNSNTEGAVVLDSWIKSNEELREAVLIQSWCASTGACWQIFHESCNMPIMPHTLRHLACTVFPTSRNFRIHATLTLSACAGSKFYSTRLCNSKIPLLCTHLYQINGSITGISGLVKFWWEQDFFACTQFQKGFKDLRHTQSQNIRDASTLKRVRGRGH